MEAGNSGLNPKLEGSGLEGALLADFLVVPSILLRNPESEIVSYFMADELVACRLIQVVLCM